MGALVNRLSKAGYALLWMKNHGEQERALAKDLRRFFAGIAQDLLAAAVEGRDPVSILTKSRLDDGLVEAAGPALHQAVLTGAITEWSLNGPRFKCRGVKADPVRLKLPDDVKKGVDDFTAKLLTKPYWLDVANTVRDDVAAAINEAVTEGKSGKELADAIQDVMGPAANDVRAMRIARSEQTGSLNAGAHEARKKLIDMGVVKGRAWLSIIDRTTRDSHEEADGQEVANDEKFVLNGVDGRQECDYPGDTVLTAAERVN